MGLPIATTGRNTRPTGQSAHIFSGSDFLTKVTVKFNPAAASDRILLTKDISPSSFFGTRLTQLSTLWERYRFVRFNIRYVPAVPTTLACQLVGYFDTDPTDDPTIVTNPDALIRQAVAHAGAHQWNFIAPNMMSLPQRADDEMYYTGATDSNERFNLQGKFTLIQVTNPISFAGAPLTANLEAGSLYIDWTCKFQIDQIEPESAGGIVEPISVAPATLPRAALAPNSFTGDLQAIDTQLTISGLKENSTYAVVYSASQAAVTTAPLDTNATLRIYPATTDSTIQAPKQVQGAGRLLLSLNTFTSRLGQFTFNGVGADRDGLLVVRTDDEGRAKLLIDDGVNLDVALDYLSSSFLLFYRLLV